MHAHLHAGFGSNGAPVLEPVHVEPLGGKRYLVQFTPGLIYGVAAGDVVELEEDGKFAVVLRGGNIAVRVYSEQPIASHEPEMTARVEEQLGGTLDGKVEKGLAYTVPVAAGFSAVEQLLNALCASEAGLTWEYGNVYAEDGAPLNWWQSAA
jgi:Domain of unknown function (DUF4265)